MEQEIIGCCPICNERLVAAKLACRHCGLELTNDFTLSKFNYLNQTELEFIEMYLRCQGNLKELQKQLKLSYPAARKQFDSVLSSLGYLPEAALCSLEEAVITELPVYEDESQIVKALKKKLNTFHGKAAIPLKRGGVFHIYYETFGNGLIASNLPQNHTLTWKAFDCAIEVLEKNKGKVKKGQAMKARLGEPELTLDTLEGYVAFHAFGIKKGEFTLRTVSALSSILEWSGICRNGYGYVELIVDE